MVDRVAFRIDWRSDRWETGVVGSGVKAMLPGAYPERAFSSEYALKDIRYALRLGEEAGLYLHGADNAKEIIKKAIRAGYGKEYFPALAKVIIGKKKS